MAVVSSGASAVQNATLNLTSWWLKDPLNVAIGIAVWVGDDAFAISSPEPQGVFRPLGRRTAVVVSDAIQSEEGSVTLGFPDLASYQAFTVLRNEQRTLLLQSPYGTNLYVRLRGDRKAQHKLLGSYVAKREVTVGFVEVDAP